MFNVGKEGRLALFVFLEGRVIKGGGGGGGGGGFFRGGGRAEDFLKVVFNF